MTMAGWDGWAVLLLSAALVYGIRFFGLTFGNRLPRTGPVKRAMDALPGTIFAALVFPSLVGAGALPPPPSFLLRSARRGSVCLAMLLGMASVSLLRLAMPGKGRAAGTSGASWASCFWFSPLSGLCCP